MKLTEFEIKNYQLYLQEQERCPRTVSKYVADLMRAMDFFCGKEITKTLLIEYKGLLVEKYSAASVNSIIAAINGFLKYNSRYDLCLKPLKLQRTFFQDDERELTKNEYFKLVRAAELCSTQLSLLIQTICSTGIRVSELQYITVEALNTGRATVRNKGKLRTVFLPKALCAALKKYASNHKITCGSIFVTKNGKALDRSNIWRSMKKLCTKAGVSAKKVFPHNLRHLFAQTFYTTHKDITRLADILGHSSIATTRIYTAESGDVHYRQINEIKLLL